VFCIVDRGGREEPLACAATCAHDTVLVLAPLKLAAFNGAMPSPIDPLMTIMSFWMFCMLFAASWIC
jgi:hypothetical protein